MRFMRETAIHAVVGEADRKQLAEAVSASASRVESLFSDGPGDAAEWGLELVSVLSDLISAALPLWDSAMAVAALGGANTVDIGEVAGITHAQVARRLATTPELEDYASQGGAGPRRVSRDGLAVARSDLVRGALSYSGTRETKGRRTNG